MADTGALSGRGKEIGDLELRGNFRASWTLSDDLNTCSPPPCTPPNGGTKFDSAKVIPARGMVSLLLQGSKGAQMVSVRNDFHYGTYYFLAAAPDTRGLEPPQGSVFGLFAFEKNEKFKNNEIDFEFLTRNERGSTLNRVFLATHSGDDNNGAQAKLSPQTLLGQKVWYIFDWKPNNVTFYVFANRNGSVGDQLASKTIRSSPTDEARIIINTWAGNASFGGNYPSEPVVSRVYEVHYYPAFFPEVSAD